MHTHTHVHSFGAVSVTSDGNFHWLLFGPVGFGSASFSHDIVRRRMSGSLLYLHIKHSCIHDILWESLFCPQTEIVHGTGICSFTLFNGIQRVNMRQSNTLLTLTVHKYVYPFVTALETSHVLLVYSV